jgi:two-component system, chemotaxis family, chemotaxis protein CheY
MKTLIVEDDFTSRLLLQTLLSPYGECHVAVNGREAVDAFLAAKDAGGKYDLICMDIMMPEMDGQAALKEIRALEETAGILPPAGVKIIMVTAVSDTKAVFASYQELCDGYLFKPIETGKLVGYLKSFGLVQ